MVTAITVMIRQSSVESANFTADRSQSARKGTNTKRKNIAHNFGRCRCQQALRTETGGRNFTVRLFVDTPGVFCGIEAEERGQGEAIARNLWNLPD